MNASVTRQIVNKQNKKYRFFKQNFHQTFFKKMKKHIKRVLSEKFT